MNIEELRKQVEEAEIRAAEIKERNELKERLRKAKQAQKSASLTGKLLDAVEGLLFKRS